MQFLSLSIVTSQTTDAVDSIIERLKENGQKEIAITLKKNFRKTITGMQFCESLYESLEKALPFLELKIKEGVIVIPVNVKRRLSGEVLC